MKQANVKTITPSFKNYKGAAQIFIFKLSRHLKDIQIESFTIKWAVVHGCS